MVLYSFQFSRHQTQFQFYFIQHLLLPLFVTLSLSTHLFLIMKVMVDLLVHLLRSQKNYTADGHALIMGFFNPKIGRQKIRGKNIADNNFRTIVIFIDILGVGPFRTKIEAHIKYRCT